LGKAEHEQSKLQVRIRPVMRPSSDGVWTTAGRFCFLARASAGSTNIVVTTPAAMMPIQQRTAAVNSPAVDNVLSAGLRSHRFV
jgi:hypothetical protein